MNVYISIFPAARIYIYIYLSIYLRVYSTYGYTILAWKSNIETNNWNDGPSFTHILLHICAWKRQKWLLNLKVRTHKKQAFEVQPTIWVRYVGFPALHTVKDCPFWYLGPNPRIWWKIWLRHIADEMQTNWKTWHGFSLRQWQFQSVSGVQ